MKAHWTDLLVETTVVFVATYSVVLGQHGGSPDFRLMLFALASGSPQLGAYLVSAMPVPE